MQYTLRSSHQHSLRVQWDTSCNINDSYTFMKRVDTLESSNLKKVTFPQNTIRENISKRDIVVVSDLVDERENKENISTCAPFWGPGTGLNPIGGAVALL